MSAPLVKLCLLILAMTPLLTNNLRTGLVKNGLVGPLFVVGFLVAIFGTAFGAEPLKLSALLGWGLAAAVILPAAAYRAIPGGTAKFLIALLPWFAFGDFMLVLTIGMFSAAAVAYGTGKNALIVPPMMLAAFAVGLLPIFGFAPF